MNFKTAGRESGGAAECGRSNAIDSEIVETAETGGDETGNDETFVSWAAHNGGCSTASGMRPSTLARRVGVASDCASGVSR